MKKTLFICVIILCILICSCSQQNMPATTLNSNTPSASSTNDISLTTFETYGTPNIEDYDIVIFSESGLDGANNGGHMTAEQLEEQGFLYPRPKTQVDEVWKNKDYEITICGNTYKASYLYTTVFSEDVSNEFLQGKEEYVFESRTENNKMECVIEITKKNGKLSFLHIDKNSTQMKNSSSVLPYYSEGYIKENIPKILADIYGEEFLEYFDSYYTFEFSKKGKDIGGEGYMIKYRAYINGIPTDDVLTIWLTLDRKLWSVSAPYFLQYLDIDVDEIIPVKILDQANDEFIKANFDYEKVEPLTDHTWPPKCFIMTAFGELYYRTIWTGYAESKDFPHLGLVDYPELLYTKAEE